ncbi:MAG TPA: hypothetical protein VGN72_10695 [Tepidisphaeraceae bacterium]|nr:hypothetical protein [Tepidisphaeraceae bacterium]
MAQQRAKGPASSAPVGTDEEPVYAGLSARQGRAIDALLQGQTITQVALAAGASRRAVHKWMHRPRFRAALLDARREAFGQAIGLTQRYAPVAVATLVKVMNDAGASANAKVAAAAVLLKFGREGIELDDLAVRVEVLEQALQPHPGQRALEDQT